MSSEHPEIIIIKRISKHEEGHHGGAWKIAFADFMTAMMAFFLVLWIINATDKDTKTIIARYFNPVKLEDPAKAPKGIHGSRPASTGTPSDDSTADGAKTGGDPKETDGGKGKADAAAAKSDGKPKPVPTNLPTEASDSANPKATTSETALFSDPYLSLDRIAGGKSPSTPAAAAENGADDASAQGGSAAIDALRDPFTPIGRGSADVSGDGPSATAAPPANAASDAAKTLSSDEGDPNPTLDPAKLKSAAEATAAHPDGGAAPTPTPGHSGGGAAPAPTPGHSEGGAAPIPIPGHSAATGAAAIQLTKELQNSLGPLAKSSVSPAIDVRQTDEGLLISLTDRMNYSMFAIGSAEPQRQVIEAMDSIAQALKTRPGTLVLRGHTDARPYKSETYDNWRLSSARAQMAYYMLTRAGVPARRFERVEGYADHNPRDPQHPLAAENRRIEILVREAKP